MQCKTIPVESFYNDDLEEEECVKIEGPSERKLTSNHTIHMWEITASQGHR